MKLKATPWIAAGIQNYIKIKTKPFKNYINKKDITPRNEIHVEFKKYRNMLSTHILSKLFKNYINKKDITPRNEIHVEFKKYRNMLSTFTKKVKRVTMITFSRTI